MIVNRTKLMLTCAVVVTALAATSTRLLAQQRTSEARIWNWFNKPRRSSRRDKAARQRPPSKAARPRRPQKDRRYR